ncbi:MAG: N-acetylmuramoyl-L-alanine amidase [Nitrospirales bacterium]|nr:N-acetylmuramoyl-L-alanine amidase [Nitrospirales bacterium]
MTKVSSQQSAVSSHRGEGSHSLFIFLLSLVCALTALFSFPSLGSSSEIAEVRKVSSVSGPEGMRVVIDLSARASFKKGRLSNPDRLFVDVQDARLKEGIRKAHQVQEGPLQAIRLSQYSPSTVRVVCDLGVSGLNPHIFSVSGPERIIIEFASAAIEEREKRPSPVTREVRKIEPERDLRRRIVIDAGHGGHDPGAVGPTGLKEKDVVLDIALRIREIMEKEHPLYDVILTRDKDVFIPLDERAAIANRSHADLFVSVHANASPNRKARGMETYLLNWTNDGEAMRVAARENAISLKKMRQVQDELAIILTSLERESKRDDSVLLAGSIQRSLASSIRPHYPKVNDLGVKQALFYVLVGAKMPSTLVEVSFVSNPDEEGLLSDEKYRQQLARSIVSGIDDSLISVPRQQVASAGKRPANPLARPVSYRR